MRLRYPLEKCKEDLVTALVDRVMVSMTDHFIPRQRYRGTGNWKWSMQR